MAHSKTISECLPTEILIEAIRAAPIPDVLALCRTCKLFYDLCVPVLYRVVNLDEGALGNTSLRLESFCHAVRANSRLPKMIRSLVAECSDGPEELISLALDTFQLLLLLEHLKIDLTLETMEHHRGLLQWSFPYLVTFDALLTFECCLEPCASLPQFLVQHPSLLSLSIRSDQPAARARHLRLSRLRQFRGPVEYVPMLNAQNLREVSLSWSRSEVKDVEVIFRALASMTSVDTPFAFFHECDHYSTEIVEATSRNIRYPEILGVRLHLGARYAAPPRAFIECLKRHLPSFTRLKRLSIGSVGPFAQSVGAIMVRDFGNLCPTLEDCYLMGFRWQKVNGSWQPHRNSIGRDSK
ncbi:hypothetical protein B0H14DRAFT_2727400 [Mycena olivaceomarginata]|nr:hypothetical protein B0H14DRAFT_2727400 [Mycena olivaceomarginata]